MRSKGVLKSIVRHDKIIVCFSSKKNMSIFCFLEIRLNDEFSYAFLR